MQRFQGKVALVTGAGTGIGLATARRLKEEGATVVCGLLSEAQRGAVSGMDAIVFDVSSEDDWKRAVAHVVKAHGGLDVLVNNAGVGDVGAAEATDRKLWDKVMNVNLWGPFLGCKHAIPEMRRRGGGAIVNLASINAMRGNNNMIAYAASKGGVLAMTMSLAMDHAKDNIRVNCVCPATIDTPMVQFQVNQAPDREAALAAMKAKHPIGRLAQPEEVASAIVFLASSDASFMTGLAIPVDGARSIR